MNSEIKLPVSELKGALTGLGKVVSKSAKLPVLQSVRVSRDKQGVVSLQGTDLSSFATYRLAEAQTGPELDLVLPLEQLSKAAKASSAKDSVILIIEGKDQARLRYSISGSMIEQEAKGLPVKEWPQVPEFEAPPIKLEKGFGSALKQALECCSDDPIRYVLNGACLDVEDNKFHYVVGTNGRMLYSANSFCFDLKKPVIIPDSKFLAWTDLLDEEGCGLGTGRLGKQSTVEWVKLESSRWSFITKQIDGNFPNWKQVIPKSNVKAVKIILTEVAIKQLLSVIPKLPGDQDKDRPVRLRAQSGLLFLDAKSKQDKDWTSIGVQEGAVKGSDISISLNREFLAKALRFGLKHIEINDELSPLVFWEGGRRMVVMPLRPDGPAPRPAPSTPAPPKQESAPTPQPETTERKQMPRTTAKEQEAPVQTNGSTEVGSVFKPLVEKVDQIRETLKTVMRDLGDVTDALKQAEKEKRATEKEIEGFRASLRKIQNFSI
jgi:DNA polymerase III sliding clamp (beta) subunit (PCNA family)